jgi:hypothetical protein
VNLEINVHRIGGVYGPRHWRREYFSVNPHSIHSTEVVALDNVQDARLWIHVELSAWTETVIPDFLACRAKLLDINGQSIGLRPAYVYSKPHDIPTYTSFDSAPKDGLYVLSMRVVTE